jgi:hypothetical protein
MYGKTKFSLCLTKYRGLLPAAREKVTGKCRKLSEQWPHNLYSYQFKVDDVSGTCSTHAGDVKYIQNYSRNT